MQKGLEATYSAWGQSHPSVTSVSAVNVNLGLSTLGIAFVVEFHFYIDENGSISG